MINVKRLKVSGAVTAAAFVGAFGSRWVDQALAYPAWWQQILMLIASGVVMLAIVYFFAPTE